MCVLASKIWPLFKKLLVKKYPFLWWNQEIFNSLKQPFFSKSRKKVKTFQKPPIFKKTRKIMTFHHIYYKYSQVHNTKTICLFEQFQKHSSNIIVYCSTTGSLKTIDSWQFSRKLKIYGFKIYPFLGGFTKFQVNNTPISWFHEIGFKIPLFSWNLEHTLDHKCPWRFPTGHITSHGIWNECFNKIFIVFKFKYQLAIFIFLLYKVNNYLPTIHVIFCHTSKPCDNF